MNATRIPPHPAPFSIVDSTGVTIEISECGVYPKAPVIMEMQEGNEAIAAHLTVDAAKQIARTPVWVAYGFRIENLVGDAAADRLPQHVGGAARVGL